ncbi:MAG: hypothetical protein AB7G12_00520 [Thermoanaerobaculia bacterium]
MSLVSEALKKAEKEAAAREARAKGLPAPLETPLQPYRARRGQRRRNGLAPLVALLGIAAVIALVFALARRPPADAPPLRAVPASEPAKPATPDASPAPPPTQAPEADAAAAPPATSADGSAAPSPAGQAPGPDPEGRPAATTAGPAPAPHAGPGVSDDQPAAARPKRDGEPFVRRVEFADGSKLELGGIAYSEAAPFAYLNGKLLAVGESTAGYTLVRILRDRVVVRGEEGELTILLKAR